MNRVCKLWCCVVINRGASWSYSGHDMKSLRVTFTRGRTKYTVYEVSWVSGNPLSTLPHEFGNYKNKIPKIYYRARDGGLAELMKQALNIATPSFCRMFEKFFTFYWNLNLNTLFTLFPIQIHMNSVHPTS